HNTIQTLLAASETEGVVVVCPANAKAVWPREAEKWRPGRFDKITICDGAGSFRWPESPRELVVINYDALPWTPAQIKEATDSASEALVKFDADEAAGAETDDKKRARLMRKLAAAQKQTPAGEPRCPVL